MASIVILTMDKPRFFKRCVKSILKHTTTPYELVLVANGSSKKTLDYIDYIYHDVPRGDAFRGCQVLKFDKNIGITQGRNAGSVAATHGLVLWLDDDAYINNNLRNIPKKWHSIDWLERLTMRFRKDSKVGALGQTGGYWWPYQEAGGRETLCDDIMGYCLMFRREFLHSIGLVDPNYGFFWREDTDWTFTIKSKGYKLLRIGYIGVYHGGSGSGDDGTFGQKTDYLMNKWRPHKHKLMTPPDNRVLRRKGMP